MAVGEGDGRIASAPFLAEEGSEGASDDLAAADDHHVGPVDGDLVVEKEGVDRLGGAGEGSPLFTAQEAAQVERVEAVDIFFRVDLVDDAEGVDRSGEGELDQDAVDFGGSVELFDGVEELFFSDACGEGDEVGGDPDGG